MNIFYPDSMKARVVVEEFHLLCRKWPQNLLNGEELETNQATSELINVHLLNTMKMGKHNKDDAT